MDANVRGAEAEALAALGRVLLIITGVQS
jgi:hypothetical protein